MKVEIWVGYDGTFVQGTLEGVLSEQDGPYPHVVVEMRVDGRSESAKVTLDEFDLSRIVRLARSSAVQKIQDAVR